MGLNTTEQVLLIILCAALAIFLILAITLLVYIIKVVKKVKLVAEKAEKLADKAETIVQFFDKTGPKVTLTRLLSNIAEVVMKRGDTKGKSKKSEEDE